MSGCLNSKISYHLLHPTNYKPQYFLHEENVADEYFENFSCLPWKAEYDKMNQEEKMDVRKEIHGLILRGDPEGELLMRESTSREMVIPCITKRKRNGKVVEFLKYNFDEKKMYYGQRDTLSEMDSIKERLTKLEKWSERASDVVDNMAPMTRTMTRKMQEIEYRMKDLTAKQAATATYIMNRNYRNGRVLKSHK